MIIFVAWPTNNIARSNETAKAWAGLRYQVAVATELPIPPKDICAHRVFNFTKYDGYYRSMNTVCQWLVREMKADIVVCAGDGIMPDTRYPAWGLGGMFVQKFPNGLGIMQAIGHRWQADRGPGQYNFHDWPSTERRCESPWIGREFILRAYGGRGPYSDAYAQYYGDAELHDVAQKMGVLWRNENVAQRSIHWSQVGGPEGTEAQHQNYVKHYENDCAR